MFKKAALKNASMDSLVFPHLAAFAKQILPLNQNQRFRSSETTRHHLPILNPLHGVICRFA